MHIEPENTLEHKVFTSVGKISSSEILVKSTGREEVSLLPHSHPVHQIIYTLTGTLHIISGGSSHFVTSGNIVWIPAGTEHCISSNNRQISLVVAYFHVESGRAGRFTIYRADDFVARNLQFLSGKELINADTSPDLFDFATSFFRLLPSSCSHSTFPSRPVLLPADKRLEPVLEYVRNNFQHDISIRSVASRFGFSVRNLTRMFTAAGVSFVHYLNYCRIVRAIEILSDRSMNIEQTAYQVGFNSPNSFSRVFRQITGESPSSFL